MNIQRRLENHYKRWNVRFDQEEQFRQLKNRTRTVINNTAGKFIVETPKIDREFAEVLGEDIGVAEYTRVPTGTMRALQEVEGRPKRAFGATRVCEAIDTSEDLTQLVTTLQVLFLILEKHECSHVDALVVRLRRVVGLTPNIEFRIARRGKSIILYPAGAELLDGTVVNDVLAWLKEYPKVAKYFERALKTYMEGNKANYRSLFDDLRFALEQLLKQILGNSKSLEKQEQSLLVWVKARGVHQQIANMYKQLLFGPYSKYQNNAVKHGEEFSEVEVEFVIYLTGTFMRLLLNLRQDSL